MNQLLLVRPGFMNLKDRKKLEKAGAVVVETEDFSAFKLINTDFLLASDDFAIAALETLCENQSWSKEEKFAAKILAAMKRKRSGATPE